MYTVALSPSTFLGRCSSKVKIFGVGADLLEYASQFEDKSLATRSNRPDRRCPGFNSQVGLGGRCVALVGKLLILPANTIANFSLIAATRTPCAPVRRSLLGRLRSSCKAD